VFEIPEIPEIPEISIIMADQDDKGLNLSKIIIPYFDPESNSITPRAWLAYVELARKSAGKRTIAAADGSPRYVEMSSTDLSMCQRLGKIYLCTDQRIVKRPNQYSCLYSLFVGDHKAARQVCQLTLEAKKYDQVVSTSSDSFLHYSVNPSTFIYKCQNNSVTRGHQLAEITEIQIPKSCRVETSNFILYRQNDLYKQASQKSYQWTLPPLTFLSNDTSIVDLNSAVKAVEKLKGAPPITTETIEKLKRLNKPFYLHTFPVVNFLIAMSGLLLVLAMIALVTYRACQSKRINRMQRDPVHRFKELLKDEGNLELLEQLLQQRSKN
jgi:hypothetical protein